MTTQTDELPAASTAHLYRLLWRWHFFAALLVIPFVLWQSATGLLYLWHEEWADTAHAPLRFVTPQAQRASYDAQVAAARQALPGAQARTLLVPDDPRRSTQILFETPAGLPYPAFVDPYTGRFLGSVPAAAWMPGWSRELHGGWPLGDAGSWLLELGACWAVVMILSGLYLWWPRGRGLLAALLPRFGQGRRLLWRDLHACVAAWFSLVVLGFLVTALPWTSFWGNQVLKPIQQATGQVVNGGGRLRSTPVDGAAPMTLDQAVQAVRARGLQGCLEIGIGGPETGALVVRNRRDRASQEAALAFDRYSQALLRETTWADYPAIPRFVATGVDLHEATFFGRANQWFNTLIAAALVWLSVSGFVSWWTRRPRGSLGVPRAAPLRWPAGLAVTAVLLCIALPLLGLSVLAILLLERLARPLLPRAV